MVRALLVRHAQTEWNAQGRWQGLSDIPLSALGVRQAEIGAAAIADLGTVAVASSDLRRAADTAEVFRRRLGQPPVILEPDLREFDVGEWQGLTRPEIQAGWPGALDAWWRGDLPAVPGGELRSAFVTRIVRGLLFLARSHPDPLLVVTHGGVIGALATRAGLPHAPITSLSGRWLEVGDDDLTCGERVDLLAGSV